MSKISPIERLRGLLINAGWNENLISNRRKKVCD